VEEDNGIAYIERKTNMTNVRQTHAVRMKMAERAQQQLELLYPGMSGIWIWNRKRDDGFISVPRILPIAMQAIDEYMKGTPAGHTLFCLWARSPDHPLLTIEHPATQAAETGFYGKRAVDTWRKRMKVLAELGFIFPKKGPSGDFHYVLLANPIMSIERMRQTPREPGSNQSQIQTELYARFLDRLGQIGAHGQLKDFQDAWNADRAAKAVAAAAAAATTNAGALPPVPSPPAVSPTSA
jgi:hypothetical protein